VNELWKSFLEQQGAPFDGGHLQHFGNAARPRHPTAVGNVLVDLSNVSLIRARGVDAANFLNAQLSNDALSLSSSHSHLAAWCNAKGRMIVIVRVFRRQEDFYLRLPSTLVEKTLTGLKKFILRAKVALENTDSEMIGIGVSGSTIEPSLQSQLGFLPAKVDDCETRGDVTAIRLAGPYPRFELFAPTSQAMELWNRLKSIAAPSGPSAWAWLDIMAGIPSVHPETSEAFVPQMANLEIVGGVNFKKGCYPGQEIVARMQYLGRLKQRMYRAHLDGNTPPVPGDDLYAPDFPNQSAGTVVAAQPAPDQGYDLLVIVQISSAEAGEIHHGSAAGPLISLKSLPYQFPALTP